MSDRETSLQALPRRELRDGAAAVEGDHLGDLVEARPGSKGSREQAPVE
ncbi:MAG: hypothetical protein M3346_05965 [Actinomycetota bacterium]|nr:hypothetical protein [Actinomycetota bacterium]